MLLNVKDFLKCKINLQKSGMSEFVNKYEKWKIVVIYTVVRSL